MVQIFLQEKHSLQDCFFFKKKKTNCNFKGNLSFIQSTVCLIVRQREIHLLMSWSQVGGTTLWGRAGGVIHGAVTGSCIVFAKNNERVEELEVIYRYRELTRSQLVSGDSQIISSSHLILWLPHPNFNSLSISHISL